MSRRGCIIVPCVYRISDDMQKSLHHVFTECSVIQKGCVIVICVYRMC
jgi:hypothetical protein